jgi:hypothetical protein
MLFAFLLMLGTAGDASDLVAFAGARSTSERVEGTSPFRLVPLEPGRAPFHPLVRRLSLSSGAGFGAFGPFVRPVGRSLTECAARVLEVPPTLDAGILGRSPGLSVDPRIQGSVSPCLR